MTYRSSPAFELMRRISDGHDDRSGEDRLTVIPVVVEDLPAVLPLLRGGADYLHGSLLDASGTDLDQPVGGDNDPALVGTISSSLLIERPSGDVAVELVELPGSRIDARFPGKTSRPSGGERQILALARALFMSRARSASFGILAYDETAGMDRPAQRACWRYITEGLPGLKLGNLRTLVVVVGIDRVDYGRHCAYGRGFHFGLLDGTLVRRRTDESIAATVSTITSPAASYTVLFLGAGASASSGLPLGNTLRDETIRRLTGSQTDDPLAVAREFRTFLDNHEHLLTGTERSLTIDQFATRLTLEQVVRVERALRGDQAETLDVFERLNERVLGTAGGVGPAIRAVQRMATVANRRLVVVEVNFDTLVEHGHEQMFRRFTTEEEFEDSTEYLNRYLRFAENQVPLLKVHGTIENRESCVASAEQTANGLPRSKADTIMRLTGTPEQRVPWVYVGASMRDADMTEVFNRREFAVGVNEFWAAPYLPPSVREFAQMNREHIWAAGDDIHAHSVTELADTFLSRLAEAWT